MQERLGERLKRETVVRHFKGKWYYIDDVVEHTETGEPMVVYQALYGERKKYCRPVDMFVSTVDRDKYPNEAQPYRFVSMGEAFVLFGQNNIINELKEQLA